jgi:predicted nucleic acid-binding protein
LGEPRAVVLDTDVASLIIKGRGEPLAAHLTGRTWCVSFVTVGELVKWAEVQRWGLRKWTALSDWLGHVVVLPYSIDVAYVWGQLAAAAQQRGRPRPANDMWVAACCIAENTPLATRNVKDFADFVEHHGLRLALD